MSIVIRKDVFDYIMLDQLTSALPSQEEKSKDREIFFHWSRLMAINKLHRGSVWYLSVLWITIFMLSYINISPYSHHVHLAFGHQRKRTNYCLRFLIACVRVVEIIIEAQVKKITIQYVVNEEKDTNVMKKMKYFCQHI